MLSDTEWCALPPLFGKHKPAQWRPATSIALHSHGGIKKDDERVIYLDKGGVIYFETTKILDAIKLMSDNAILRYPHVDDE